MLEASDKPGGAIQTVRRDGWILETGPNTILATNTFFYDMIDACGLQPSLLEAGTAAANRFIVRDKKPMPLPSSPGSFFRSRLFDWKSKLALLREPFVDRSDVEDETLASFVERRLGRGFLDYAINPFVAGVYAGKPEKLSVKWGFPKLHRIEQKHGSLIIGQIKGPGKDSDPVDIPRNKAKMISFREGNAQFPKALTDYLGREHFAFGCRVSEIAKELDGSGYIITTNDRKKIHAKSLILTIPLYALGQITFTGFGAAENFNTFGTVSYPPVNVLHLGFKRHQVKHPLNGFGVLVPEVENLFILGALFNSEIFPDRTPDADHVLITVFTGGSRHPDVADMDDHQLVSKSLDDLRILLGVDGGPEISMDTRWLNAIPQYETGYGKIHEAIGRLEAGNPGFFMEGNFRDGISVADCIKSANARFR